MQNIKIFYFLRKYVSSILFYKIIFCTLCLLFFLSGLAAQDSVLITVQERVGVDRTNEFVKFGIPIPRSWNVTDASNLRLRDNTSTPIPAQFEALARWGSYATDTSAPIKWVLVGYFETISASASETLELDALGPGPSPSTSISIDTSTPGTMIINTGTAQFDINSSDDFNIINQVTISSQTLLESLSATDAIDYSPAGSLDIVAGGSPDFTPRTTSVTIERSGPLYVVIKVEGSILDDSARALLDFTARLHFYAGKSGVRVDFTVENNQPVIEGGEGQPANAHNQGDINSVYIGELELNLRLRSSGAALHILTEDGVNVDSPTSDVTLYQDSSGTDYWNAYVGLVGWPGYEDYAYPRLQSYCAFQGYQITGAGSPITGLQALGWMSAFRSGATEPQLTVAVKDFWQNFPKVLEGSPDGTATVNLFPNGTQFNHNFRVGEEKTHSILYHFGLDATTSDESQRLANTFNNPLFGVAPASWYVSTGVLGEVPVVDIGRWSLYERYVRTAFEPNPDFDPLVDDPNWGNSTLLEKIDNYNFYGWQDYGDVPLDYEAFGANQAGQMNLKYWLLYGMFVQFCRSADLNWLDIAQPGAWHMADIDYLHIPDEGIQHWVHGAYFGHSQHDEPGNLNPNRNSNSPSVDLFFGVPGLILGYYLTGEQRFLDTAQEGLEAMLNLSQFSDFTQPIFERERANLIFGYIEGYRQTGDSRWYDAMRNIVGHTADLSNKQWVTDPATYGASHPGDYVRMFMFNQVVWTLGRYLDFCNEYGLPDDLGVANALQSYGDFVIKFAMNEYEPGRAAHPYDYVFDGSDPSYLDINNWSLAMADALSYVYKYNSNYLRFLNAAAKFYATGTIDPVWQGDPPVYISTKDLTNHCNWGLVYMNQSLQQTYATNWYFY